MNLTTLLFALLTTLPTTPADAGPSAEPVLLDFTATWCGPCRQMRPAVDQLIRDGYPVRAVDVDRSPALAKKYDVSGVPCFIVVDPASGRELGRTEGLQPVAELAAFYNQARAKLPRDEAPAEVAAADESQAGEAAEPEGSLDTWRNPKPYETVVRIKVHGVGSIGFGSGTIISSNAEESVILTCAHIFKMDGGRDVPPSQFRRKITIDLFDGNLKGPKHNQVHYSNETLEGQAIDYDFSRDVGLIRIRPGRKLPYARVVPTDWKPRANMANLMTVGCSEGRDATAWLTNIVNPNMKGLNGNGAYEAIECTTAPIQGRSGGGLFTPDGYVAGVCDFAEPRGNHGLYAHPRSIYKILDKNNLMAAYDPSRRSPTNPGAVLARNRTPAGDPRPRLRTQSPSPDDPGSVRLPKPEMLGIPRPVVTAGNVTETTPGRRGTWHATGQTPVKTANLEMDPSADPDKFGTSEIPSTSNTAEPEGEPERPTITRSTGGKWRPSRAPLPVLHGVGDR